MYKLLGVIMLLSLVVFSQGDVQAKDLERQDVPESETWNLEDLYASPQEWEQAKNKMVARFDDITQYKGKLGESAEMLLACLKLDDNLSKTFSRLYSYASMKFDQDTREARAMAMRQEVQQLGTRYNTMASFMEPEIVAMSSEKIDSFLEQEPELKPFKMYLHDLQRRKEHKLSAKEEKIVAEAGLMASAPYDIYSIFSNADLPYPKVELSTGEKVTVNQSGYTRYRALTNREDRERVFQAFFGALSDFSRTFATQLDANMKKDVFYSRVRNYNSTLESALDANNIPVKVYHSLIENVNDNLDTFHRYLKLKQRMLGVEQLKYSDLYAPVVKGLDLKYSITEAQEMILESMGPLGDDYVTILEKAFDERWIDYHPTLGKRSGAYSNGSAYDVHPYILMNYNDKYDDVSTLAHELGHSLHSYFSNVTQPHATADYPIFVAEVASTLNEALLIRHELDRIENDETRLSLLMSYLDGIKGTVFRQTQFAEYELAIHEKAEEGTPLTNENLTQIYGDIVKKYYGHEQKVCQVDSLYTLEWAYIPHFYYNYYVYQYATSYTASTALSEKILNDEEKAVEKYIKFISSGGSKYPIELLKEAGVDLTTPEPFEKTMVAMNRAMDEIETILDRRENP